MKCNGRKISSGVIGLALAMPVVGVLSLAALSGAINGKGLEEMLDFRGSTSSIVGKSLTPKYIFNAISIDEKGSVYNSWGNSPSSAQDAAKKFCSYINGSKYICK